MLKPKLFSVFEHRSLILGDVSAGNKFFEEQDLKVLVEYYGKAEAGCPYFSLGYNCVWFNEYVGVLQVGHLTIEVLPKTDENEDTNAWRNKLIDMLRTVHEFEVSATSNTDLSLKSNSILEYYITLFLTEVETLLHKGLIKKYKDQEENILALKGRLVFSKHFTKNLVHKERFYVNNTVYDRENLPNRILYKALKLVNKITNNSVITTKAGSILLVFPEMPDIKVSEHIFDNFQYNRKTEGYKTAISIAKLLLLNYHPDIKRGRNDVIALMFDMNLLWEKFVYIALRKNLKDYVVHEQVSKLYWKSYGHSSSFLKPDIKISKHDKHYIVDTKWQILKKNNKPAHEDLRQMFAYTKYLKSSQTILLYPGNEDIFKKGFFLHEEETDKNYPCSVCTIALDAGANINMWQKTISEKVREYL